MDTIVGGAFGATVHRPAGYVGETESGTVDTIVCGALGCADVGFPLLHAQGPRPLASEEAAWATGAV